jgi:hypothetical protein
MSDKYEAAVVIKLITYRSSLFAMPSISGCPRCHRVIQIHSLADATLELRCPHCLGTFPVSEIAASSSAAPLFARPANVDPSDAAHEPPREGVPAGGEILDAAPWTPEPSTLGFGGESRTRINRAKSRGVLGPLIGIVLGGVVGLSLGYVLLIWFAGRSGGDVLHVLDRYPVLAKYLPGADR